MQFIRYIGTSHRRIITAADFRSAGVPDQQSVEWSYANNFAVPIDDFTDSALRVAIEPDPTFVIVGGEQHEPRYLGQRMTGEQAMADRVDVPTLVRGSTAVSGASTGTPGGTAPTTVTTGPGSGSD